MPSSEIQVKSSRCWRPALPGVEVDDQPIARPSDDAKSNETEPAAAAAAPRRDQRGEDATGERQETSTLRHQRLTTRK